MIRFVAICRVFVSEYMLYRWRTMARDHKDMDITIIGHREYSSGEFGVHKRYTLEDFDDGNFHYRRVDFRDGGGIGPGIAGLEEMLMKIRPDFVYLIGLETSEISFQVSRVRRKSLPKMKMALFTMRGLDYPKISLRHPRQLMWRWRWARIRNSYDAIFCHYPHGRDVIREQGGYRGPIYMQTQVGVNNEWFRPDADARKRIRAKFGISDDTYLFGTSCRINYHQKGIGDILAALPISGNTKFMFIGDGPDMQRAKDEVKARGLEDYVIFTGFISLPEPTPTPGLEHVQDYFNALDCFVLMSRTSKTYIDTYPLVLSQAMATALPCIVSTSGALPYEVGDLGDVVPEQQSEPLKKAMEYRYAHQEEGREQGKSLCGRLQHSFEMHHLNRCFVTVMNDILAGRVVGSHFDQQNFGEEENA